MEVFFPKGSRYPLEEPPLIGIRGPILTPLGRRSLSGALAAHAQELVGEPLIYSLVLWLDTHLPAVLESELAAEMTGAEPRKNRRDQGSALHSVPALALFIVFCHSVMNEVLSALSWAPHVLPFVMTESYCLNLL